MKSVYYNELDPFAAAWLRELIKDGLIPDGDVDERDIRTLQGWELASYTQVHLFAGIGGWAYALHLADWPSDRPVWTGSCPCQPFSAAGKQKGTSDERHLWPEMRRLVSECDPPTVFGEQVASRLGREWLAGVRADLEALGYEVGAADLCAAGVGAPHIRQRLYWLADADKGQCGRLPDRQGSQRDGETPGWQQSDGFTEPSGDVDGMADAMPARRPEGWPQSGGGPPTDSSSISGMGNNNNQGLERRSVRGSECSDQLSPWAAGTFIRCLDGKARRIEPGIFPLANGVPNRMGTLRGAGNAIVPQVAAKFIQAYLEADHL